jgi:hypothetical protein
VLSIEPFGLLRAEEELAAVGVRSRIGHGEDARSSVLEGEVLIGEFGTIDRLATRSIVVGEVTTLAHELGNHAVERGTLVAEALLARAQGAEVL